MRITNNMMIKNTAANINGNKGNVLDLNNQMASQKKIQRPSQDPVIAIRALRLRTSLSKINQYYEKNIPDVQTWFENTETSLKNMNKILTDIRTQCVNGTNSYLTQDDRKTILSALTALKSQIYSEGNSDNAGRTVFTGYKTNSQLTFMEDEAETSYKITQSFSYKDIEEYTYYSGSIEVPTTLTEVQDTTKICEIDKDNFDRIRLAYDDLKEDDFSVSYTIDGTTTEDAPVTIYASEEEWAAADPNGKNIKQVGENEIIFIQNTGDVIFGSAISQELKSGRATIDIDYQKEGFAKGELRPEYYYNCTDVSDAANPIEYTRYDENGKKIYEDINYTVALNQTITVNMQADEVFDMSIYQDVVELTDAVSDAINAHDKLDRLKLMKEEAQYVDHQEEIQAWIDAAQKEADYADNRLTELYSAGIGNFDNYMSKLNQAYTEVGARGEQLEMIEARLSNQQLVTEELKSTNEDKEISDIIIEYTAAYNAYQASLQASSKANGQTLLNYL